MQEVTVIKNFDSSKLFSERTEFRQKELKELGYIAYSDVDTDGIYHIRIFRENENEEDVNLWEALNNESEAAVLESSDWLFGEDFSEK